MGLGERAAGRAGACSKFGPGDGKSPDLNAPRLQEALKVLPADEATYACATTGLPWETIPLRSWCVGDGTREIARSLGLDRKTVRTYTRRAQERTS